QALLLARETACARELGPAKPRGPELGDRLERPPGDRHRPDQPRGEIGRFEPERVAAPQQLGAGRERERELLGVAGSGIVVRASRHTDQPDRATEHRVDLLGQRGLEPELEAAAAQQWRERIVDDAAATRTATE